MTEPETIVKMPDRETVKAEAGAWIARRDTRGLSVAEQDEFNAWLRTSAMHSEEYERLASVWGRLDGLDELNYLEEAGEQVVSENIVPFYRRRTIVAAIAASLVAIVAAPVAYQATIGAVPTQEGVFSTALGEQDTIELVDGSTMVLNTDSVVEVSLMRDSRTLRLLRGEAHFDVAENKKRPFAVYAGDGVVKAVGTAFTVHLREASRVEVTVTEGRVQLLSQLSAPSSEDSATAEPLTEPLIEMAAGENALFRQKTLERIEELPSEELSRKLSWRRGLLAFKGELLPEAVAEIGRYTDFRIEIADPTLEELPIGGYFKVGEVEGFLRALEASFDIGVERLGENHVRLYLKT